MSDYPRETTEFQEVRVTIDGTVATENVSLSILTQPDDRPTTWFDATILNDKTGFMVTGYQPGSLYVWVKVTDSQEIPVIYAGRVNVT